PGRAILRPARLLARAGGLGARRRGARRRAQPPELGLGRGEPRVLRDGGPARAGGRPPRPGRARGAARARDQARLPGGGRAGSRAGGRGVAAVKAAPVDTAGADCEACGGHAKGGSVSRSRRLLAVSMTLRCPYCSTTTFLLTARFPWVRRSQKTPDGSPCPPERSTRCWPAPRNPTSRHATTRPPTSRTSSRAAPALGRENVTSSPPRDGLGWPSSNRVGARGSLLPAPGSPGTAGGGFAALSGGPAPRSRLNPHTSPSGIPSFPPYSTRRSFRGSKTMVWKSLTGGWSEPPAIGLQVGVAERSSANPSSRNAPL